MRIQHSHLLAGLLCLLLAAGCTTVSQGSPRPISDESGTPSSRPGTSSTGEEELPFAGAPKVDDPLDTTRYQQDPCRSLTANQAQTLNLPTTGKVMKNVALGVGCEWNNESTRGYVSISFVVDDPRGLSPEYAANQRGKWAYFAELPNIEGYPAVKRSGSDDRDIGACSIVVGVADDMVFVLNVQLSDANVGKRDPCEASVEVASLALQTMKKE